MDAREDVSVLSTLLGDDAELVRERNFQLLLLANTMGPLGTAVMSPILDSLTGPYGASPAEIGLLMSAFSAPPILVIPITGHLADRYGRKPLLLVGLLFVGAAGTALAFTTDFRAALGLRLLQGVGFAAIVPIVITSIGDLYDGTEEATAQGLRFTSSGVTNTVFPLLAGALVVVAWQYPFLLFALAFPIAAIVYRWFDEPARRSTEDDVREDGGGSPSMTLRDLLGYRRVQAIVLGRGLPALVWISFYTYNSIIVVRLNGGTPAEAGVLAAVGSVAFAAGATQTGRVTARFDAEFTPLVAANAALGLGFAAFLFAPSQPVALVSIVVAGAGFGLMMSIFRSLVTGLAPTSLRGSLVSISEANGRLLFTLAPIAMGIGVSLGTPVFGFDLAVRMAGLAVAAITVGGGLLCLLVARSAKPVPSE